MLPGGTRKINDFLLGRRTVPAVPPPNLEPLRICGVSTRRGHAAEQGIDDPEADPEAP
jgi:hypothetical protein